MVSSILPNSTIFDVHPQQQGHLLQEQMILLLLLVVIVIIHVSIKYFEYTKVLVLFCFFFKGNSSFFSFMNIISKQECEKERTR